MDDSSATHSRLFEGCSKFDYAENLFPRRDCDRPNSCALKFNNPRDISYQHAYKKHPSKTWRGTSKHSTAISISRRISFGQRTYPDSCIKGISMRQQRYPSPRRRCCTTDLLEQPVGTIGLKKEREADKMHHLFELLHPSKAHSGICPQGIHAPSSTPPYLLPWDRYPLDYASLRRVVPRMTAILCFSPSFNCGLNFQAQYIARNLCRFLCRASMTRLSMCLRGRAFG